MGKAGLTFRNHMEKVTDSRMGEDGSTKGILNHVAYLGPTTGLRTRESKRKTGKSEGEKEGGRGWGGGGKKKQRANLNVT